MAVTPPLYFPVASLHRYATLSSDQRNAWQNRLPSKYWITALMHALLAGSLAFWLAGRRGRSKGGRVFWACVGAAFGMSILFAIIAIFPRPVRRSCSQCRAWRCLDRDRCEYCGAEWEKREREGIEIFESDARTNGELIAASVRPT